jgi:DNA modification methylase
MTARPTAPPSPQTAAGQSLGAMPCCLSSFLDRVIHGDNCETLAAMPAESVDLVVTSPPYDDLRTYGGHSWDFYGVAWLLKRVLKPGGVIVWVVGDATVNGSETGSSMMQALHFRSIGLNLHDTMTWSKPNFSAVGALQCRYAPTSEFMFVLSKGAPKSFNPIKDRKTKGGTVHGNIRQADGTMKPVSNNGKAMAEYGQRYNVWEIPTHVGDVGHPAPFPHALASDHIQSWSNPGDVVLDPFAGSGTTLKAAKELGRRFVGIEINAEYVEICQRRIAQEVLNLFPDNKQLSNTHHLHKHE